MKENFDKALELVLHHEGGFVNHPKDPGGATNKGVTLQTFQRFFGQDKTVDDLKKITTEQLGQIYKTGYWNKCYCDDLPSGLDYAVFDAAVNSGPGRSARWLQSAVGSTPDGAIGPNTLGKVADFEASTVIKSACDQRLSYLQSLKIFSTFGKGWTKRVNDVRRIGLEMSGTVIDDEPAEIDFDITRLGSRGEWVSELQEALGVGADGIFGKGTEAALIAFQKSEGLEADGIAGRGTYRALGLLP